MCPVKEGKIPRPAGGCRCRLVVVDRWIDRVGEISCTAAWHGTCGIKAKASKQVTYPDRPIDQVVGSVLCLDSRPVHRVLLLFTVCVLGQSDRREWIQVETMGLVWLSELRTVH
jgi:hypothetical protein